MEIEDGTWQIANCAGVFLPSAPITSWQRGEEKSFRTHSEKSLSLPEANLSVWGTLAAAPHLHKHSQHSPVPHSSPWIAASGIGAGARARAEAIPCVRAGCYSACCRLSTPQQRHTPLMDRGDSVCSGPAGGVGPGARGRSLLGVCPSP